ncbi:MAG TPA: TetR/AcrR family transcriptional regulator [Gammaproteobacteria bacterium]|nr:TetR/AcrR family transcriptional regulator [Gammaproteobacteria bacterium]
MSKAVTKKSKTAIREDNIDAILFAAESVFAERGYKGATTTEIARRATLPKANLHYYFETKEMLYKQVLSNVAESWLAAANTFDTIDQPVEALTRYIHAKMDLSRSRPEGSKVWANEIMRGAPVIQHYLETTLQDWTASRVQCIQVWIKKGLIRPIEPLQLLYMIWATTQHYADFTQQITTLNDNQPLSDKQFESAKLQVTEIILRGIGAL